MPKADVPFMSTDEIRSSFLEFFESKGCAVYASSSLIPDDPSLLVTNAGMNQFKQYYLGTKTMEAIGATSCQKCLRTNDIDVIGLDGRHLSFFEMLGNFSFGGYTKEDACTWALEYCCDVLRLPKERLHCTVFTDDDECAAIWEGLGIAKDHISRLGEEDNFWAAGPTGPCGPCSEIYFDQGEEVGCGRPDCAPGCDCDRFLEFWNLVFTQYDRQEDGTLVDLPQRNVDTGMGLERISAIMQGFSSNYEGDILKSLIELGEAKSGRGMGESESTDVSLRIIADHARAVTFMIADGILPANEGRGYILRRLLRRAIFHGRLLGIEGAFLNDYAKEVQRLMGATYPELVDNFALVEGTIAAEEERFSQTLGTGRAYLKRAMEALAPGEALSGLTAFTLHDTYGFPVDLTREIAEGEGHAPDMEAFEALMAEQRERARAAQATEADAWTGLDLWTGLGDRLGETDFMGYEDVELAGCTVETIVVAGESVDAIAAGAEAEVVLDRTPFYAEKGGQVGDEGILIADGARFVVDDCQVRGGGLEAHVGRLEEGELKVGDVVTAVVDVERRELVRRNHTATHLLDAALREVLGEHVHQAGSLVAPDRLRFDFTHFEALTAEQIAQVEGLVNEEIFRAIPVTTEEMPIDAARAKGAIALFGEKYGDVVRVVSVEDDEGAVSMELCGGTHARNTAELGLFKIVSESSVGAASRRIEAVTSKGALAWLAGRLGALDEAAAELKCPPERLPQAIADLRARERQTEERLRKALSGGGGALEGAVADALELDGYKAAVLRLDGREAKELRGVWDTFRERLGDASAAVIASVTPEGKVALLAAGTQPAVDAGFDAGSIVRAMAEAVGGRGGGRPTMAQAGGKDAAGVDEALARARERLRA